MISLGIEGTAHTLGVGIVDDDTVLADIKKTYVPESGGIHPRESSRYIADNFGSAVGEALEKAGISKEELDLISFSKGPGLGPCLSNTAVGARALALSLDIPIIGVNHCVAHIEIGNMIARKEFPDWAQPLTLYVSGANTQIIMFRRGRYRVFGETLDIGTGNMLDKFGRKTGLGHPAGPKIEKLGRSSDNYIELPYVIKGNDLSLSGLLTESIKKSQKYPIEDICYSLQETSFAMLTEATERALCHLKSDFLLLTGGVANNKRLQEMVKMMAEENGADFSVPKGYCGDNGTMIAWTGLVMHKNGVKHDLGETAVDSGFRTDQVDIGWAVPNKRKKKSEEGKWKGAEAVLTRQDGKLVKERIKKEYRIDQIDSRIRKSRTKKEPKLLSKSGAVGVPAPKVFDVLEEEHKIIMEYLDGNPLYRVIEKNPGLANELGRLVRTLHDNNIVHGDLTTSNIIQKDGKLHIIDFGLGNTSRKVEDKATDLLLLKKALNANHSTKFAELWERTMRGYGKSKVLKRLEIAEKRGRYL